MAKKTLQQQKLDGLARAIGAAGTQVKLARKLRKHPSIVAVWLRRGQVSHLSVLSVEAATGVPCHELRPDLYRRPKATA